MTQSSSYAVVLSEVTGKRRLPIIIGGYEAQAIAVASENMQPNRPLTHDLLKNSLDIFNIHMKEVVINKLLDGVFYSKLICEMDGFEQEIDSRTSDALAMAVRFKCPIYTYENILETAGIIFNEEDEENPDQEATEVIIHDSSSASFKGYSLDDLEKMLEEVLGQENYQEAAKIRDEISKRKK
jgi:uncharacterized protein